MKKTVWFGLLAAVLLAALSAGPVFAGNHGENGQGKGPATHIVVFHDDVDPDEASADLAQAHGLTREFVFRHALSGASFIVPPGKESDVAGDPRVASLERNQRVSIVAQAAPTGVQRIFADENPNITIDGNDDYRIDVDVAVIDTGIDLDHPDLNVVASTNCAKKGPTNSTCTDGEGDDGNGHGSHVAGTIGALDNGVGVVGVAPGARLWAVKVLDNSGSGWMSWIIAGIDWVTAHAGEIEAANMSLGCECSSSALDAAIHNSVVAGVVYAVAAGNSDKDASTFSPANHPDVITVSALADFDGELGGLASPTCRSDEDDTLANFSNWGSLVEITAPGVCILSTYKDGGYATFSGTSMASPHTAGAAALRAATAVNDTPGQIRSALISNGNFNWTDDSGDGSKEPLLDVSNPTVFNPATVAGSSPPSEPDTTAPVISGVAAGNISDTSADISWSTDEASDSVVNYGATTALGSTASVVNLVTSHLVGLSGLTAETTYSYEVQSTDSSGNTTTDNNGGNYYTFTTAAADTTGPVISGVAAGNITDTSADISWSTDEASDSVVNYGTTTTALGSTASVADLVTSHLVGLSGLTAETTYSYEVQSTDSSGNTTTDNNGGNYYTFTTAAAPAEATTVSVSSITYTTEGGQNSDKHLNVTVVLVDNLGIAVAGASVSIRLDFDQGDDGTVNQSWTGTATTGSEGKVTFTLKNAPSGGCYTTKATAVTASGLTWDGVTPENQHCKL